MNGLSRGLSWSSPIALLSVATLTIVPLATAQRGWEVHGQLGGIVTGWHGAVIAVPVLRTGTISGGRGTFKLRSTAPGGCYEAIVRTGRSHFTHLWFSAPDSGLKDLGEIEIAQLPHVSFPIDPPPPVHDTIATCQPKQFSAATTWPAVHAVLLGQLLRGSHPLAEVPVDLACGNLLSVRSQTDSAGRFRFYYPISFPDDQMLADNREAECRIWIATVTLDQPRHVVLSFGPHHTAAPQHQVNWAIPEPDLRPRRVIGRPADRNAALRLEATASFSPGVLDGPATAALELIERPHRVALYEGGSCSFPNPATRAWNWQKCEYQMGRRSEIRGRELLPIALRVSTGQQQATTGSDIMLALPAVYAARAAAGDQFEAFARLPARYGGSLDAFVPVGVGYWPSLRIVTLSLIDFHFDDERTPEHAYEAIIVFALRPPQ